MAAGKRMVVTGGSGFIGSHIVDALLETGAQVLVIDNFSTGREDNLQFARSRHGAALQVAKLDICSSEAKDRVIEFSPSAIFHTAAQANVRRSVTEPCFDAEVNILGTINMLESARAAKVEKFIFSSTGGAIYGEQDSFPADETHKIAPECQYGVSKRAAEIYMELYARTYNFLAYSLRYANVYGPRQNPKGEAGVVAIFINRLLANQGLTVFGDGEQTRDFVFVKDVVAANLAAYDKVWDRSSQQKNFFVFNVGTAVEQSVNYVAEMLRKLWVSAGGEECAITFGPLPAGEQRRSVIDFKLISRDLCWSPKVGLKDGLSATLDSFRSERLLRLSSN